ncbi:hypothetical protein [Streptomyces boninensis]|uniref:hypothetical protein n=1 Tax=Streptomyces boninensis TaxID=2039455 RepID=UPI003B223B3F
MPAARLRRRAASIALVLTVSVALPLAAGGGAEAVRNKDKEGPNDSEPSSGGDGIGSKVSKIKYSVSSTGTSGTSMASADANWDPPKCWFEPRYTNEELEKQNKKWEEDGEFWGDDSVAENRKNMTDARKGKKGMWYERTPMMETDCPHTATLWVWVAEGDPDPPEGTVDPEILAGLAYKHIKLPKPPVRLSPSGDKQKVNLPTQVKFGKELDRAWATASLNIPEAGIDMAATTVAEPYQLKIDAGTDSAAPRSCTYDLEKGGGGYQVNSADEECNVTYQRSSRDGTYPLSAQLIWKVTWNQTDGPDGPPEDDPALPNGTTVYEQDVTVKEVQTVTR